jgi:hypothetical protein
VVEKSGKGGDAWLYSIAHGYSYSIVAVILMPGFRLQRPSDVDTCSERCNRGNIANYEDVVENKAAAICFGYSDLQ